MIDYNNIDDITNILYDFVYNNDKKYIFEKFNIENITLNDIVKNSNFDYSEIFKNSFGLASNSSFTIFGFVPLVLPSVGNRNVLTSETVLLVITVESLILVPLA